MSTKRPEIALSIKQPWATLVLHGLKSIEIRTWRTDYLGRVLIHTGKVADNRPEAWRQLPTKLKDVAQVRGGLIGSVEITGCIVYSERRVFAADQRLHGNDVSWFRKSLYGFLLSHPETSQFRPLLGNIKFFPVPRNLR